MNENLNLEEKKNLFGKRGNVWSRTTTLTTQKNESVILETLATIHFCEHLRLRLLATKKNTLPIQITKMKISQKLHRL